MAARSLGHHLRRRAFVPVAAAAGQCKKRTLATAASTQTPQVGGVGLKTRVRGTLIDAKNQGLPITVGLVAELEHTFQPHDVQTFARVCGDDNPIHLDDEYARQNSVFNGSIVHGVLVGSLFSTIFGSTFPGAVYLSQSYKFSRPIYVGKPFTARVEVTSRRERPSSSSLSGSVSKPKPPIITCSTHIIDEEDMAAISGEAIMLLPEAHAHRHTP